MYPPPGRGGGGEIILYLGLKGHMKGLFKVFPPCQKWR